MSAYSGCPTAAAGASDTPQARKVRPAGFFVLPPPGRIHHASIAARDAMPQVVAPSKESQMTAHLFAAILIAVGIGAPLVSWLVLRRASKRYAQAQQRHAEAQAAREASRADVIRAEAGAQAARSAASSRRQVPNVPRAAPSPTAASAPAVHVDAWGGGMDLHATRSHWAPAHSMPAVVSHGGDDFSGAGASGSWSSDSCSGSSSSDGGSSSCSSSD